MDFKDLASRLGFDEAEFRELVELFVTTTRSDIDKIKQSIRTGNSQDAAAVSHSIKGAAGNLGFENLFALAKDMEFKAKAENLENFETFVKDLERQVTALSTF